MTFPYSEPVTNQFTAWCANRATGKRFLGNLTHGSAGQRSQHQTQPGVAARAARSPPRAPAVTQRHADGLPIQLHVVSRRPVDSSGVHPLLPGSLPFRRVEGSNGSSEAKNLGKNKQKHSRERWLKTARHST